MKRKCTLTAQLVLAAVIAVGFGMSAGAQTTREVNQNDPGAQYQTIGAAVADSLPGDTVLVHPGTYEENVTVSGITLKALRGPEATVIQSPDGTGDGVTLTGNSNVSVIGFRVQGFVDGIKVSTDGGNTTVANCITTANSGHGFYLDENMPLSAKIINNISADNGGDGFYWKTTSTRYVLTSVFNNISYRNGGYGFNQGIVTGYSCTFGDYNCVYDNTAGVFGYSDDGGVHSITTNPSVNPILHYRFTSQASPCVNTGHPGSFYNDPDGSRNDMGAYGGAEAANWWRDPFTGPTVFNVTVDPPQVSPGGAITIRATATTE